ncbi:MAG TPA: recombination regulator RecX [Burkholderiaceae bacterium]|nr:recombination regulator RecX [Burkholderiaceae bacterium]
MSELTETATRKRPPLSLKGRALRYLARREHSRLELSRKLAAHAESREQLGRVLDELEAAGLLSNQRFAESLVHRKAERFGTALIRHELRSHRLDADLVEEKVAELGSSETARAHALWLRRFGHPPESPQERARQMRFLVARGFRSDVVRRVVAGAGQPDFDETDEVPIRHSHVEPDELPDPGPDD